MEIIIFIAVVVIAVLLWNGYVKTEKTESDNAIDSWIPGGPGKDPAKHPLARFTKSTADTDKPWPYGEKIAEGKIHVKSADVAPKALVEVSAASMKEELKTPMDVAVEQLAAAKSAKKAPAKKRQFEKKTSDTKAPAKKPAAAKRIPAKKKST